jgi:nicotinamide riboside kinase
VEKRKMRLRFIVKQMAKKRLARCARSHRPQRCRQWVRRKTLRVLKKIAKICPYMVCKHLGYCDTVSTDNVASKSLMPPKIAAMFGSPSLSVGLLDQQLETYLTQNVCNEFEQLQTFCVHLAASIDSRRYAKLYMAVLDNDTKWIDNDLRKQVQSAQAGTNVNICDACKNVIQSSKDFFLQALVSVVYIVEEITNFAFRERFAVRFSILVNNVQRKINAKNSSTIGST